MARVAFPMADPHVLVGVAVGDALPGARGGHARHRAGHRLVAARRGRPVVHLPGGARLAPADRPRADALRRVIVDSTAGARARGGTVTGAAHTVQIPPSDRPAPALAP